MFAVELRDDVFGDEELGAVSAGAGVGHGEAAGLVEGEGGVELIFEHVAGVANAGAERVATLDHEAGDDAVEDGAVIEPFAVDFFEGEWVRPVLGGSGEADEVGDGDGSLLIVELAGEAAHGGVKDNGGAGGDDGGVGVAGGAGGVGKVHGRFRGGRLCERGCDNGEEECERTNDHAVKSSIDEAIVLG